jgi:histidyl-tRNA synthetase
MGASKIIQGVRGFPDLLPAEAHLWQKIEGVFRKTMQRYAYNEIRLPFLEKTELFQRGLGEATDVVSKEMYAFADRHQESICLRPEGTAGIVRAGIEHGLLYHQMQKWWSYGPMFRYERPQKGRTRQFFQWSMEVFGAKGPVVEAELLVICSALWAALGLQDKLSLELNTLGNQESRLRYREVLVRYFNDHKNHLSDEEQERLSRNPLRLLDSKNPVIKALIQNAPLLSDYIDPASRTHHQALKDLLDDLSISYHENAALVRGLDYYGKTVFEWTTTELGAQGTVCAGGRYDTLVEQLGGPVVPAAGLAIGMDRIVALCQPKEASPVDIMMLALDEESYTKLFALREALLLQNPTRSIAIDLQGGTIKGQLKRAHALHASLAIIMGEEERMAESVTLKWLYQDKEQHRVSFDQCAATIKEAKLWFT